MKTGWPPASRTPSPRKIGSRKREASSSPTRLSRQIGGCENAEGSLMLPAFPPKKPSPKPKTRGDPNGAIGGNRAGCVACARVRAVTVEDGNLVVVDRPDPEPGKGQILVSVRAAGLSRADVMQPQGRYPA